VTKQITIEAGAVTMTAELDESTTAQMIWDALPITASASTWGDEIYFAIPVEAQQAAEAREDVSVGELGYWPVGRAFCIFFGPTPVSPADEPRAASPVNPVGRVLGDPTDFRSVRGGAVVVLRRLAG
jgi:hypothetical protein